MIDYLETLLAEEEEWESALGLPRWPRRGRENEFLPEDRERETAPAPEARQLAQAAMGGREVTPFALTESLEQRTTADWGELDRAVQRDARRYDGGFFLY